MKNLSPYIVLLATLFIVEAVISDEIEIETQRNSVYGKFPIDNPMIAFNSEELDDEIFDIIVEVNGITLTALVDQRNNIAVLDGYSPRALVDQLGGSIFLDGLYSRALENQLNGSIFQDDAGKTYISKGDRALLSEFNNKIFSILSDYRKAAQLQHVVSIWAEYPVTLDLTQAVLGEAHGSLCQYIGKPVMATHDDAKYNRGDDKSTLDMAYVSPPSWRSCSDSDDETWFNDGSWSCFEPDHDGYIEMAKGNCFGNCGSGCSGSGLQMTKDCHDHDQCVRNGHFIASLWCNDEFTSAIDDELFAPDCQPVSDSYEPQILSNVASSLEREWPSTTTSLELDKLNKLILMMAKRDNRVALEIAQQSSALNNDLVNKNKILFIRQKELYKKIAKLKGELRNKIINGDDLMGTDQYIKQQRVRDRAMEIDNELNRSQGLKYKQYQMNEQDRITEIIEELEQAKEEALSDLAEVN